MKLSPAYLSHLVLGCCLAACTPLSPPQMQTQTQAPTLSAPATPAYKAGKEDPQTLSARIEPQGKQERIVFQLGSNLSQRLSSAISGSSAARFHTQASDISQLRYLTLTVSGPDIPVPIQNSGGFIPITGVVNGDIVIPNVPVGFNHVITAQFYDANKIAVPNAVAMGIYSSGMSTVDVRRRFLVAGRIINSLLSTQQNFIRGFNVQALQSQIDKLLYGGNGTPGPFVVDPELVNTTQVAADLLTGAPVVNLNLNQPTYILTTASFSLPVTGLLGSDTLTVRVDDPTSTAVTQGNGTITVTNIAPGKWPVYIKLNSSNHFAYPNTTLGATVIPPSVPNQTTPARLLIASQTFTAGQTANPANYDLVPAAPQISTTAGIFTRSGQSLTITGSGFYPGVPAANKVKFVQGGTTLNATVTSATATELVITVPAAAQPGAYTLSSAVNTGPFTPLGNVAINVLAVIPNGPNYNAGTTNGQGWAKGINLQSALSTAAAGDEIWVAAGTYSPGPARLDTFTLKSNVPVYGGFAGTESARADRNFASNISILNGDVANNDNPVVSASDPNRSENTEHIVTGNVANITLDGFTLQGGNANGANPGGGALFNDNVSSIYNNLIFKANTGVNGGAVLLNSGTPTISNSSFINNASSGAGAGIFNMGFANPTFNNLTFMNNASGNGGGIYNNSGTITLNNGIFISNTATGPLGGGGMYNAPSSTANVTKAAFIDNSGTNGGGVYNYTSSPVYTNVVFTGNSTTGQGGGMFNNVSSNPKLVNVTMNGNTATGGGSALYNASGSPVFVNVLLWNNVFGNIALPGSQGNVQAGANPFVQIGDPDGIDNTWFTSDDGLQLSSSADLGIATFGGVTIPTVDILGTARPQGAAIDSGAYEKP